MANRRFEMFEYRQVLTRMRLGDTDRAIARSGLMGRAKAAALRRVADAAGWLDPARPLPPEAWPAWILRTTHFWRMALTGVLVDCWMNSLGVRCPRLECGRTSL